MLWIAIIGLLGTVAWQDFRYHAVYAWLSPLLAVLVVTHSVVLRAFSLASLGVNLLVIMVQLGLLNVLVYWHTKRWLMHGDRWIGWSDIAFFMLSACCFSTINFVVFYVTSLVIILFGTLAAMAFGRFVKHIPVAGGQAVLLVLLMMADYPFLGKRLYMDIDITPFSR